jgi:hypothetical protein
MKPIWYFLFGVWTVAAVFLLAAWWPFLASAVRRRFLRDRRPELIVALEELEKAEQRVAKVHSALSRWWGYYCTGLGIIESTIVKSVWRFAHRKGCAVNIGSPDLVIVRRELINHELITNQALMVHPGLISSQVDPRVFEMLHISGMWRASRLDLRVPCRKCGRIHQRTMTYYQPL